MSKLLKSKILLGFMIVAVMLIGVAFLAPSTTNAATCDLGSTTLKYGQRSEAVRCLQTYLNVVANPTTYFGTQTLAKVKAYQANNGLVADGKVGAMTKAKIWAGGGITPPVTGFAPQGCTSASGFSPVTGGACYAVNNPVTGFAPAGCTSASGFSPVTGGACYAVGGVPQTGPITVALAMDNPASGAFLAPATGVEFAKFTFSGTGTVTSVKLMRTGISSSGSITALYLYDGTTRLTDGASLGSDNIVTFNNPSGLFTVAGTKTIRVVATTALVSSSAEYSLGFTMTGYTAGGVVSTVSIAGNQMYGATASLSTLSFGAATGGVSDPGTDVVVWQSTATVGNAASHDVILKSLALRQVGSIASADIGNFKLYADGVLVNTVASLDANGYVTFTPNAALKTGARVLKVTADITGGSARTVSMSLRGAYDVVATDVQYNANGVATGTFPNTVTAVTVTSGTMTVIKATDSPSGNLTVGASDQTLAKFKFTAYGEAVKVETLRVGIINTGGGAASVTLRNGRILVDGLQVGSNTDIPAETGFLTGTGTQFTTNFMVYPGTPAIVEIHADLVDNEGADEIATPGVTSIQALLVGGGTTANGVPQVSITSINVPTAVNVTGNNRTVASGVMTVAKNLAYASQTIAVPQTNYKVGSFTLTGNATEAVNLNTIYVGFADTTSDAAPATDLSDLYVTYGGTQTTVKGTVTCTYSSGCTNPNSWTTSKVLGVNEIVTFDVYASIASSLSTNSFITTLAIAGTTANSGIATYADASGSTSLTAGVSGQEITGGTGSITVSKDASTSVSQLIDDSGTFKSLTAKFAAVTDSYTVTDITVTLPSGGAGTVSTVTLKDHTTGAIVGEAKPAAASMTWSGLDMAVASGTNKVVDVELALTSVGVGAGTSDSSLATVITTFTARNSAGTSATGTGTATGNTSYVYKAVPLISQVALSNSTLAATTMTLAKFTVSSNGTGTIAWKQTMLELTKTLWPVLATPTLWDADTGQQVTAAVVFQNSSEGSDADCDGADVSCEILISVGTNADDDTVEQISGAKTYEVRSVITGTQAAGVISVTLDRNTTTHANKGAYTANDNATTANSTSFVWSDESASATSDTGVSTWIPDFLVKTLPMTWSLTRS